MKEVFIKITCDKCNKVIRESRNGVAIVENSKLHELSERTPDRTKRYSIHLCDECFKEKFGDENTSKESN